MHSILPRIVKIDWSPKYSHYLIFGNTDGIWLRCCSSNVPDQVYGDKLQQAPGSKCQADSHGSKSLMDDSQEPYVNDPQPRTAFQHIRRLKTLFKKSVPDP